MKNLGLILLIAFSWSIGLSQATLYPSGANIVDVTKPPYNVDPTGITDGTAQINQAMIDHNDSHTIIYFPEGVYRLTNTLEWGDPPGCESGTTFTCHRYTMISGAGIDKTILKLDDNHPDFQDANNAKLLVWTKTSAAMSFENGVRNMTINIGSGNPGAHGLGFEANNQGGLQNVKIKSEDGQGQIGLHMGTGDQVGPCLIRDVEVDGFKWGIYTFANQNSIYFERISLKNQTEFGFYNRQQSISIKDLVSVNEVPAIYNHPDGGSMITMINSSLTGIGNATNEIAFRNNNRREIFLRNVNVTGYGYALQQLQNGFSLEIIETGLIEEYTTEEPDRICDNILKSLNLPIEELPEIVYEDTSLWVSIEDYGASIDNGFQGKGSLQDDTQAIQDAFNSGASTILVPGPRGPFPLRYIAYDTIKIPASVKHIIGSKGLISGSITFEIEGGTVPLFIEDFAQFQNINHFSARDLILKNLSVKNYSSLPSGSGDVFIEDVVGGPYIFNNQNVWARQFNTEKSGINVINNGGNLWVFGMKTEKKGTAIKTTNGGKTEVLGTLFYGTLPDETDPKPIFDVVESSFSVAGFKELGYINDAWDIKVRETRNGVTNDFTIGNSSIRSGLFVSYASDGSNKAPTVDAGPDQIITFPQQSTSLSASINDDGLPSSDCFAGSTWRQIRGPQGLMILNPEERSTTLNFTHSGKYELEIEADDGELQSKDTISIFVYNNKITTLDHNGDGSPSGIGADANLRGWSNFQNNYGGSPSFGPRNYNSFPAKSIIRLDLSESPEINKREVRLEFELATTNGGLIENWNYNVFGLKDGHPNELWVEGSADGSIEEGAVNYENAPGNSSPHGGIYDPTILNSGGADHSITEFLGTISTRKGVREKVSFTSPELINFVNEDQNGAITFFITRESYALNTIVFASKENESFSPPTLYFADCPESGTWYVDASASTGTKSGESWNNAFRSLDAAIESPCIKNIDTIKIASGTYTPFGNNRSYSFTFSGNTVVEGGYPSGGGNRNINDNETILSGNIGDPDSNLDNLFHVIRHGSEQGILKLDGITIQDGRSDGIGEDAVGAAILNSGQLILKNMRFVKKTDDDLIHMILNGELVVEGTVEIRQ